MTPATRCFWCGREGERGYTSVELRTLHGRRRQVTVCAAASACWKRRARARA